MQRDGQEMEAFRRERQNETCDSSRPRAPRRSANATCCGCCRGRGCSATPAAAFTAGVAGALVSVGDIIFAERAAGLSFSKRFTALAGAYLSRLRAALLLAAFHARLL